jgi:DNA repair photolyase
MSKMFPFITATWNPLKGACQHGCSYCWATKLIKNYNMKKYTGPPSLSDKEMLRVFKEADFVFVCDMTDLFGDWVSSELIQKVLDKLEAGVKANSHTKYLLLTKNPKRYLEFKIPANCVCGATIESDCDHLVSLGAPKVSERLRAMFELQHSPKIVSVEPIMRFSSDFKRCLANLDLEFVAIGYDNYSNGLDEPSLEQAQELVEQLEECNILVYQKTMREKVSLGVKK